MDTRNTSTSNPPSLELQDFIERKLNEQSEKFIEIIRDLESSIEESEARISEQIRETKLKLH